MGRRCLALILMMGLVGCEDDRPDLIASLANSCTATQAWTQQARVHSRQVQGILEGLKQNPFCSQFSASLSSLVSISSGIHSVMGKDEEYLAYRQKEEEFQELTFTLEILNDMGEVDAAETVKSALIDTQIELAQARANSTVSSNFDKDRLIFSNRYSEYNKQVYDLFSLFKEQSQDLSACLRSSPTAALQLASSLAAMGGSFVSPVIGAAGMLIAQTANTALEVFKNNRFNEELWNLRDSQIPAAMSCAMERMTNFYCQADDSLKLLVEQQLNYPGPPDEDEIGFFWEGLDILNDRMPVINAWLLDIRRGNRPANDAEAERVNSTLRKFDSLQRVDNVVNAKLINFQDLAKLSPDQTLSFYLTGIVEATWAMSNCGSFNNGDCRTAFTEWIPQRHILACMLVRGVDYRSQCPDWQVDYQGLQDYLDRTGIVDSSATFESSLGQHWPDILAAVTRRIQVEFRNVIIIDPDLVFTRATQKTHWNVSVQDAFRMLKDFLHHLHERTEEPALKSYIIKTITEVVQVLELIEDPDIRKRTGGLDPILEVYTLFKLRFGLQYLTGKVTQLVERDLQERLMRGEFPGEMDEILRGAYQEIARRLVSAANGVPDLVADDLGMALGEIEDTMGVFNRSFEDYIERSVKHVYAKSQRETHPNWRYRPNSRTLGRLCTLILASNEQWPESPHWNYCRYAAYHSLLYDGDNELVVRLDQLREQVEAIPEPHIRKKHRICALYRFRRAARIAFIVNERNHGEHRRGNHGLLPDVVGFPFDQWQGYDVVSPWR